MSRSVRLRRLPWSLAFVFCGILTASPLHAVLCTIDDVPGATLLLPYFEVDLGRADGVTTLFSVNNASSSAALAHVVVWSDLSVPVLDFNLYLTGYDVQSVNLRDLLVLGKLPRTAPAGQDPADTLSPRGDFSQDASFPGCAGQLPLPDLPSSFLAHLQASLTGKRSLLLGNCAGRDLGDNVARGYVTIDTVSNCTLRFPGDAGYFVAGGLGDATNANILWGDYFYVDPAESFAQGETLVHVEADAAQPQTSTPGQYTFYGRYVGWTAVDNREPLATNFAVRFLNGGAFTSGTDLTVWRDSKVVQGAFPCGTLPGWYPLGEELIVIFDEEENPEQPATFPVSPQPPQAEINAIPAEAGRIAVGGEDFPVEPDFGWLYLNLNTTVTAAGNNPPEDPRAAQGWVTALMAAEGRFSVGFDAIQLDSACLPHHPIVPGPCASNLPSEHPECPVPACGFDNISGRYCCTNPLLDRCASACCPLGSGLPCTVFPDLFRNNPECSLFGF